ncbi:hypothetical protein EDB81DRAFT_799777 [Dactylonectria macrodidyma]|uniref:RING-type domain-containing protein n=2 Tax=Dactylonectria macrodidyma TaxID=307937 RepID=A0A9P9EID8_9HYPO|nr:hypothetical protein EDB81DRAFT_799777 [Dactylonectria macrodidyma]
MSRHDAYCTACFHRLQPDIPQWRFPNSKLLYCKKYIGSMIRQYYWNKCMICWDTGDIIFFDCGHGSCATCWVECRKTYRETHGAPAHCPLCKKGPPILTKKHEASSDDKLFILGAAALLGISQAAVSDGDIDQQVSSDTPHPVQHGQTHGGSGCDHEIAPHVLSPDQSHPDRSTAKSPELLTYISASTQVPGQLHRAPTIIIGNQVFIDLTLVDDDDSSSMTSLTRVERNSTNTKFSTHNRRRSLSQRKRTKRILGTAAAEDIIVID